MLDLEVTLSALQAQKWEIFLGMPFCHCIALLKQLDNDVKDIQFWYSDQNPLGNDMVLKLSKDGIRLIFDSYNQRLKMIEVCEMDKVSLKYHGKHFNSPTIQPTLDQIQQSFGPTVPLKTIHDPYKQIWEMNFRGLSFTFTAEDIKSQTLLLEDKGLHCVQLPPGITPKVTKMCIYHVPIKDNQESDIPLCKLNGSYLLEKAEIVRNVHVTNGIYIKLLVMEASDLRGTSDVKKTVDRKLEFDMSCQEVMSEIGSPSRIFYKSEDKMRIHLPDINRALPTNKSDYVYNYFSLGLDVLFDGFSHTVKKFILHTNFPGHYDFNIYMRCPFTIPLNREPNTEHRMLNPYQTDSLNITPYTKWSDIEQFYFNCSAETVQKPVVLRRACSVNSTNPFGQTLCYGIQDMIFEVMKRNDHIASIVIYKTSRPWRQNS